MQAVIDSLKTQHFAEQDSRSNFFPFNPNYISDYKGYQLGLSTLEIDKLHQFRSKRKFVNNAQEFREITGVSDTLLKKIAPYFTFPDFTKTVKESGFTQVKKPSEGSKQDLNSATIEDLKLIYGIGEVLAQRIIRFRTSLNGFLIDDQLFDVYGLQAEVAQRVLRKYKVLKPPQIKKININKADAREISALVYIDLSLASKIIAYREAQGTIVSFDELTKIQDFPSDKIARIQLYLSL